jgi:hypothetical protein
MSNQFTSCSRDEVLEVIRTTPNLTMGEIQKEVGLSGSRTCKILAGLTDSGLVQWKLLPPERGVRNNPRRGYFIGEYQASKIPAAWDVLAHFFGRIAEPVAA